MFDLTQILLWQALEEWASRWESILLSVSKTFSMGVTVVPLLVKWKNNCAKVGETEEQGLRHCRYLVYLWK